MERITSSRENKMLMKVKERKNALGSALRNLQHRSGRNGVIPELGRWQGQARMARQEGAEPSSKAEACRKPQTGKARSNV